MLTIDKIENKVINTRPFAGFFILNNRLCDIIKKSYVPYFVQKIGMKRLLILLVIISTYSFGQNKLSVGLKSGVSIPVGDFSSSYDSGFGIDLNVLYSFDEIADLILSSGFTLLNGQGIGGGESTFTTIPLTAGVKYYMSRTKLKPYLVGEIGASFNTVESDIKTIVGTASFEISNTNLTFSSGLGVAYFLNEKLQIDFVSKFNFIDTEVSSSNFIDIKIGFNYGLF